MMLASQNITALERESWIDQTTAERFGLRRVDSFEGAELVGRKDREDYAGIVFPIYWPGTVKFREQFLRRDHPPIEDGKPKGKYLAPPGRSNMLLLGPNELVKALTDTTIPIVLVEGLKKLLAAYRLARHDSEHPRFLPCAISGVWNWRGTIGKTTDATGARVDQKGVIPDFDRVSWTRRDVVVIFDSDCATNDDVARARRGLMAELKKRGARAVALDIPALDGLDKTGFDDLLAHWGPDKVLDWLTTAQNATPSETDLEVARLATLPPLEYGKARKEAAKRWGVPVSYVDAEVTEKRREQAEQDAGPILETVEPAAEPVDGATLADNLVHTLRRFIVLDDHGLHGIVLWVLWAYGFELWAIAPILAFLSPEKRCGKTSLLSLLADLLDRALLTSNTSASAIFRVIEAMKPTLLVDEMDSFTEADEALRGILNSGHTKAAAKVIRVHGEQLEVKVFSTWCPKILAAIGDLPGTITDRAIVIQMKRRKSGESIERLRWTGTDGAALHSQLKRLAGQCKRWATDHADALAAATPVLPDALHDRAADNWHPLFAVALVLGGPWPDRATAAALSLSGGDLAETDSIKAQLLRDIQTVIPSLADAEGIWSQDLVDRLIAMEERPWGEWPHGKPMTSNQLAKQLRPFGVRSRDLKRDGVVRKGYLVCDLADALSRYLSSPNQENPISNRYPATSRSQSGETSHFQSATEGASSVSENARIHAPAATSSAVADQTQEIEPEEVTLW